MGQFCTSTFLLRYLLPVVASAIAAPVVLVARAWPAVRRAILWTAAVCVALIFVSAVVQGF